MQSFGKRWMMASTVSFTALFGCALDQGDGQGGPDSGNEPGEGGGASGSGGATGAATGGGGFPHGGSAVGGTGGSAVGGSGGSPVGGMGGSPVGGGDGGQNAGGDPAGGAGGGPSGGSGGPGGQPSGGSGGPGGQPSGGAGGEGPSGGAGGAMEGCGRGPACPEGWICEDGRCTAEGCGCPDTVAPVCGTDGQSYGNRCAARCAGVEVAHEGECRPVEPACGPDRPCPANETCDGGRCVPVEPCICPDLFAPVCGADGVTYGNPCEARCAGVEVLHDGECRVACPDPNDPAVHYISDNPERCAVLRFVCEAGQEAFSNACGCGCIDLPVEPACGPDRPCPEGQQCLNGRCAPVEPCICPAVFAPVCGADGMTYGNACEAGCVGVAVVYDGECRAPECGPNQPCARGEQCVEGRCVAVEPCVCPDIFAPVCGVDGNTYPNECSARCAGVVVAHAGECVAAVACGPDRPCARGEECMNGACVPIVACPDTPNYDYISRDPARCAAIEFLCVEPALPFFNECGCGCSVPEGQCLPDACGPPLGLPNVICADGSMGGPTGRCLQNADGACGWEIRECPAGRMCDGIAGLRCARGEQCEHMAGTCRIADGAGICQPIPDACPRILMPVCGCDGVTYRNDCLRQVAGAQKDHDGECRNIVPQ